VNECQLSRGLPTPIRKQARADREVRLAKMVTTDETACHAFPSLILEILTCRGEQQDQRAQHARVTHHCAPVTLCRRVLFRSERTPRIHDAPSVHCTHLTSFIGRICCTVSRSPSSASSLASYHPVAGLHT